MNPEHPVNPAPRVLFGQAYFLRFDPKLWDAGQPYAPLGALYAAAAVRAHGYDVALFDAMLAESEEEWARRSIVIVRTTRSVRGQLQLLEQDVPPAHAAGGADDDCCGARPGRGRHRRRFGRERSPGACTSLAAATAVVSGEGEVTLVELLDVLSRRTDQSLEDVPGLVLSSAQRRRSSGPAAARSSASSTRCRGRRGISSMSNGIAVRGDGATATSR